MWPDIKKEVPDAKLHIFYGWNLFDKGYADNPERMAWKEKINKLMEQDGIVHLGRISHEAVKEEMQKAGIWAYPTHFGEISCCSGDTPILMPRDHKKYPYGIPIRELEGKSGFYVYSYDHKTDKIKLGRVKWVKITRKNAKLLRITLDDGTILRFTPDHKFLLRNGEYKEAKDLTVGESLMPCYEKPTFAIKQTDGSWPEEHRMMAETLWGDNIKGKVVDHKNGNRYDNTPDNLQLLTPSEHTQKMATKERVQTTVSKKRMSESQKRLAKTPERIAWNSINGTNRANKFWKIFRSWPTEKQKEWTKNRAEKRNHSVIDICEDSIKEDVYDMEVDKYHTFAAGGVFVHNCITAMKAQCYGAIPVVIDYAALKETVQYGIKIDGDIYEKEIKDKYLNELVSLLKNPSRQEDILKQMMPWARETFVWSRVAEQWDKEFKTFSCPIIPLEKQVEDLMEDNQALKAWDLVKDTESPLKERVWLRVKHAFEPEAYEKYYKEEMKEVPLPEDLALDCTKYAPRFKWLIEKIEQQKPEKIIDLGCADGYTGLTLAKRGFKNYLGVNLNTASIEIAKSRAKNYNLDCTFTNKDMFEIEGKYDAVIMFEILEHLPDMKKAVEKAVSLLSDNGRLYISTPRVDHLGVELHKKEKHGTWDDGKPSGHLRLLTDHELKALLSPYKIYDFALDEERSMLTEVGKR
jgi:2-polyprenyl-3-methyl-5-hydroxy-6-metoxy-1,4-benzoquinol methylase